MEFRVLGPLEVSDGGERVEIAGSKRRALLALLILRANEVVRTDRLIDDLWGEHPPANAGAALQNHVSRLRKALGPEVLVRREWGYALRVSADSIDLRRFEQLVRDADPLPAQERSQHLAQALGLWRGPPLSDVANEPGLQRDIGRLEELHVSTIERRIDADLEAGGSSELIAELESLLSDHPLREHVRSQLILALYRAGRQAEALEVYRETRRMLAEELGLEPSPELRELERAILRQDPSLGGSAGVPRAPDQRLTVLPPASRRRHWLAGGIAGVVFATGIAITVLLTNDGKARATTTVVAQPRDRTGPIRLEDSFSGTAVDAAMWYETGSGTGWSLGEHGGHLEFVFSPSAKPGGPYHVFGGSIGTLCTFPEDFDARVSFDLVSWPAWNGITVTLGPYFGPVDGIWSAGRTARLQGGEQYESKTTSFRDFETSDRSGELRVTRTHGVVTTYRLAGSDWQAMASDRDLRSGPITVLVQGSSTTEFAGQSVVIDLKDFSISAKQSSCPPGVPTS